MNLQVANFKMHMCVPSMSGMRETPACRRCLLLMLLQLQSLPPLLFPPVSNSSCLFTQQQPLYATYCTVLLSFSSYCKIKIFCFFNVLLCEKYYKPITVQVNCVSGVLGLSLLDLQTKWTYECTLRAHSNVRDILHIYIYIYIHTHTHT